MIKVLFIIDRLHNGGKERQLYEIIKALKSDADIQTGVITFNLGGGYSDRIKKMVSFYKFLRKRPSRFEPFFTIWKPIRSFAPNIVHTWDSLSSLYSYYPSRIFGFRFVNGSIRDAGIEKGWQLFLKKYFLKRADLVIANSMAGLRYYNVNGEVIYNAIDMGRFDKNGKSNEVNAIMVANFTDYKDHKTFIKASIELLNKDLIDNIFLAGEGPHKQTHIDCLKSDHPEIFPRFHFLGVIGNVEKYLSKCRFGILCSTSAYSEGVSNSVLEYMAAGLVPIATNVGGMKEAINNRVNGFLVEEKNPGQIIKIIKLLRNDPNRTEDIIKKAGHTIKIKFSYTENINKLIRIYDNLCIKG